MATVLGEVASVAQLLEQLGKSISAIYRTILNAKGDLKDAPQNTKDLFREAELVDRLLKAVDPTYSSEVTIASPMQVDTNSPTEARIVIVNPLETRISLDEIDRPFSEASLKELRSKLKEVDKRVRKYQQDDTQREGRNNALEVGKNIFHQEGSATNQQEDVEQLRAELQKSLRDLIEALGVETYKISAKTHDHVIEIQGQVADIPRAVESVNTNVSLVVVRQQQLSQDLSEYNKKSTELMEKLRLEMRSGEKVVRDQEHVSVATQAPDMVRKLEDAAYDDIENGSYVVTVEFQNGPDGAWRKLEGESAQGNGSRGSEAAGYGVWDGSYLRFTMSVNEDDIYFHVLTYAHLVGAKLKLYYPTKRDMSHVIAHKDSKVLFPDTLFNKGPRRFGLKKEGSSTKSTESIFLVFSRNPLVRADPADPQFKSKKLLEIADVAEELEKHLEKKSSNYLYTGIIVKHFLVDIFENK